MPVTPANIIVSVAEIVLLVTGVVLLWLKVLRPSARAARQAVPDRLPTWDVSVSDFLLFVFLIIAGSLLASVASNFITVPLKLAPDTQKIVNSAAFQLGLLIGPTFLPLKLRKAGAGLCRPGVFESGVATFLIALPVITLVNFAWLGTLKLTGIPAEQQDLLRLFSQAGSPALLGLMIVLATVIAPLTEELLFRGTLFRYLRTRIPRWAALLLPSVVFAALHVDWINLDGIASFAPLVMLAVVFSIAYERTGQIRTVMVAHALFNLHTIVILFAGTTE